MRPVRMPGGALRASAADLLLQLRHIRGERSDRVGRRHIARLLARVGGVPAQGEGRRVHGLYPARQFPIGDRSSCPASRPFALT